MSYTTSHNPIKFKNEKVENLNEAKEIFLNAIDEYLFKNPDKYSEVSELKLEIEKAYRDRKVTYLLEDKLDDFDQYLKRALRFALTSSKELDKESSSLFYLKHSKKFTLNE